MEAFEDPDRSPRCADALSIVRSWLQENEFVSSYDEDGPAYDLRFETDTIDVSMRILLSETDHWLILLSHAGFTVADEQRSAVLEACNLINANTVLGNVELDPQTARVQYRYHLAYPPGALRSDLFAAVFEGCLASAAANLDALLRVSLGVETPAQALERLEASEGE